MLTIGAGQSDIQMCDRSLRDPTSTGRSVLSRSDSRKKPLDEDSRTCDKFEGRIYGRTGVAFDPQEIRLGAREEKRLYLKSCRDAEQASSPSLSTPGRLRRPVPHTDEVNATTGGETR